MIGNDEFKAILLESHLTKVEGQEDYR